MFTNMLGLLAIVAVAVLFGWLARRALRLRNPGARWALAVLTALPALLFAAVALGSGMGYYKFYGARPAPALVLDTAATPARLERGTYLARTNCVSCHTTNGELPLTGGIDLSSHSPLPVGQIVPPNLTPGGPLQGWSDMEIAQAIRNGRHQNGRTLLMPTSSLRVLSDEDVASLVVFLRSQPAVEHSTPEVTISPLLALFNGLGLAELSSPPVDGPVVAPPRQPEAAYGGYITDYMDCRTCHGPDMSGTTGGLTPPSPNARAIARTWTLEQFIAAMRTGVDPSGHTIQEPMPWKTIGLMDDNDLTALYLYLRSEP